MTVFRQMAGTATASLWTLGATTALESRLFLVMSDNVRQLDSECLTAEARSKKKKKKKKKKNEAVISTGVREQLRTQLQVQFMDVEVSRTPAGDGERFTVSAMPRRGSDFGALPETGVPAQQGGDDQPVDTQGCDRIPANVFVFGICDYTVLCAPLMLCLSNTI